MIHRLLLTNCRSGSADLFARLRISRARGILNTRNELHVQTRTILLFGASRAILALGHVVRAESAGITLKLRDEAIVGVVGHPSLGPEAFLSTALSTARGSPGRSL